MSDAVSTVFQPPGDCEKGSIKDLDDALGAPVGAVCLVGLNGREVPIPEVACQAMRVMLGFMLGGQAFTMVPFKTEVTTSQAADYLNVSRPYLIKLLETGEIPFLLVGKHRRIAMTDLVAYANRRNQTRRDSLQELKSLGQFQSGPDGFPPAR